MVPARSMRAASSPGVSGSTRTQSARTFAPQPARRVVGGETTVRSLTAFTRSCLRDGGRPDKSARFLVAARVRPSAAARSATIAFDPAVPRFIGRRTGLGLLVGGAAEAIAGVVAVRV